MSIAPNLLDYRGARETIKWDSIYRELDGFDGGGINIAHEVLDRHVKTPLKDKVALFWEGKNGESEEYTFNDMWRLTNRFADALGNLGVKKGDRIFTYMDRIPDPLVMEAVKAFISLKEGYEPSDDLMKGIKRFARKKLHALACPRKMEFVPSLPKTKSGKIMRRLLKARELGLPEGDTSTLEE